MSPLDEYARLDFGIDHSVDNWHTQTLYYMCYAKHTCDFEAHLVESELCTRFPSHFPRFYLAGSSASLCVINNPLCIDSDLKSYFITMHSSESSLFQRSNEMDDSVSRRKKRPKMSASSASSLLHFALPFHLAEFYGFDQWMPLLNDSTFPTTSKFGFIIAALGGILHLSYPPTIEEIRLYCHVYTLLTRYGRPNTNILKLLKLVFYTLMGPQLCDFNVMTADSTRKMLDSMFECICMDCGWREPTLLELLSQNLHSKEDHVRLITRFGAAISQNPAAFIDFIYHKFAAESFQYRPSCALATATMNEDILQETVRMFWDRGIIQHDGMAFKMIDVISAGPETIPPRLVVIKSSLANNELNGESSLRYLVHCELLCDHWPYFKNLMNAGLSEALSHVVTLPFDNHCLNLILATIYHVPPPKSPSSSALDLLKLGPQFGLFKGTIISQAHKGEHYPRLDPVFDDEDVSMTFKELIRSLFSCFLDATFFPYRRSSIFSNAIHIGATEWCDMLLAVENTNSLMLKSPKDLSPEALAYVHASTIAQKARIFSQMSEM